MLQFLSSFVKFFSIFSILFLGFTLSFYAGLILSLSFLFHLVLLGIINTFIVTELFQIILIILYIYIYIYLFKLT